MTAGLAIFAALAAAASAAPGPGRGFPAVAPWVSFYGAAAQMGPLERVASTFRIINIDPDPHIGNFTAAQVAVLKANGQNRVIAYLNLGACERFRDYYKKAPRGFIPCAANKKAQRGRYHGYPDEVWMDPADDDHQRLMVEHVAARLAATGVDGFFLDNMEIVEHGPRDRNGPCDQRCRDGGLALIARLRAAFPDHLIVMQNATGTVVRDGVVGGKRVALLLDGVTREETYAPTPDPEAERDLLAWKALALKPGGRPFFIGTEDYVGGCAATEKAKAVYQRSRARGFSPYATDRSSGQQMICYWSF